MNQMDTFEAARRRLLSIAYRMLGSVAEAEDVVQDTWLRWHAADARALETPVAWLTTVTTRLAIDRLRHLKREREQERETLPEPWLEDALPSGEDEASRLCELSYGVLLMLQRLSPDERAAFLLHEVFDVPHAEVARILDVKVEHSRQLVRRAKMRVQTGPARRGAAADSARLAQAFVDAIQRHDEDALVRLVRGVDVVGAAERIAPRALLGGGVEARLQGVNGGWGVAVLRYGRIETVLGVDDGVLYVARPRCLAVPPVMGATLSLT
ncbi:RNA polymerase sigma-70 factor (ECF subfamily) [Pseudoduganella flava]|uniref:RNA polymerase sigma-70 factor (ECF subfamily) n=1 Tax=Pseudoduganella flava TaxID=871742 RepID=A0A562PN91_9BURK|nr:sigma-70 family RNA polymerase sigma factor [Pseudoduganella flava]QGZ40482.1 sigma-70 family RNA polymerase sigma factor [Pseudoduganella flava]TWI45925.1 RNA polymerase sigma-70 factor (ECF subfamily) [Pseudoduganella flava]